VDCTFKSCSAQTVFSEQFCGFSQNFANFSRRCFFKACRFFTLLGRILAPTAPNCMKPPQKATKHGKERWMVDLRSLGGGRHFFPTEAEAQRFQAGAIQDKDAFGRLAFDMPHDTRIRYLRAERKLMDAGATIDDAVEFYLRTHKPAALKPISEAVTECLAAKRSAGRRPRYLEQFAYSLQSLAASVGGETFCSDVTHQQVEAWLANPKWGARHKNGKLIDARTLFMFARKRGWCTQDPCGAIERFTLDDRPPDILTIEQVKRLFVACQDKKKGRPGLLPFLALGIFCGIRPEEIKRLAWSSVNIETGYVEVSSSVSKTRQRRLVKIQPNAIEWLRLKGDLPPLNWRRRFATVRKLAGFRLAKGAKRGESWPHDAMRHSFCSYSLPVYGASQTAAWAGHSESMLFKHYRELVTLEAAREFWSITPESITKSPGTSTRTARQGLSSNRT
jgi:integrase